MRQLILVFLLALPAITFAQPNILLIYVDDLGYGDLGSYGHPVIQTPNIDALAEQGMKFNNYYAPSALCSPSRAGLLTGRHPYRTGIESWIPEDSGVFLRAAEITLAEVLQDAGYATAHIGKWHLNSDLGSKSEPQPTDQGFDYFYGHNAFQIPTNRNPVNIFRNKKALGLQEGYTADLYAGEAIDWLEQRDANKPFFLYLSMAEPHTTIENPPEYNQMYDEFTKGEIVPIPSGTTAPPKEKLIPRGPGEYFANITYMDAQLGRVLDWVTLNGLDEDTVVVFSSDNGPVTSRWINHWEVNAYGSTGGYRGRKHMLYEGGIKVPTVVRYPPLVSAGSETDALVVGMDLFVTLANLGGGKIPGDRPIDGIDIRGALAGDTLPARNLTWALDSVSELEFAFRSGQWKLMLDRERVPRELFNLDDDPLEFFNLIDANDDVTNMLARDARKAIKDIYDDPLRPRQ